MTSGIYYLVNSSITTLATTCGDGVELVALANNVPVMTTVVDRGTTQSFNTSLGNLVIGDTIEVAIGPNSGDGCDSTAIDWDVVFVSE